MVPMALALTSTLRLGSMVPEQSTVAVRSLRTTLPASTVASALPPALRMDTVTTPSTTTARTTRMIFFTSSLPLARRPSLAGRLDIDHMNSRARPRGTAEHSSQGSSTAAVAGAAPHGEDPPEPDDQHEQPPPGEEVAVGQQHLVQLAEGSRPGARAARPKVTRYTDSVARTSGILISDPSTKGMIAAHEIDAQGLLEAALAAAHAGEEAEDEAEAAAP